MPIKRRRYGLQRTFFLSKRWERLGLILGWSLLAIGVFLLCEGNFSAKAARQVPSTIAANKATSVVLPPGPLSKESEWGMWHQGDVALSFPTTQHPYTIGQTIAVPNTVTIRVDSIDRNWTPQPWQVPPFPVGYQDDATGKEVILVRFTITNLGNTPINYSDHYFSLIRANGNEQRVAVLDELTGDRYGSFGQPTPWLLPGVTVHTFVPFLVNPGEKPQSFVFSWQTIDSTRVSTVTAPNGKQVNIPAYINVARIPVILVNSTASPSTSQASKAATSTATFVPDTTFHVTNSDVYAKTGN